MFQIVLITSRVWFPLLGPRTASVAMGLHVWCVSCKRLRQEALLIGFACSYTICIAVTHGRTGQINCKQSDVAATSTPIIDAGWKHNKVRIADLSSLVMLSVQVFFRAWSGLVKNMKKASLERNQSTHPRKSPKLQKSMLRKLHRCLCFFMISPQAPDMPPPRPRCLLLTSVDICNHSVDVGTFNWDQGEHDPPSQRTRAWRPIKMYKVNGWKACYHLEAALVRAHVNEETAKDVTSSGGNRWEAFSSLPVGCQDWSGIPSSWCSAMRLLCRCRGLMVKFDVHVTCDLPSTVPDQVSWHRYWKYIMYISQNKSESKHEINILQHVCFIFYPAGKVCHWRMNNWKKRDGNLDEEQKLFQGFPCFFGLWQINISDIFGSSDMLSCELTVERLASVGRSFMPHPCRYEARQASFFVWSFWWQGGRKTSWKTGWRIWRISLVTVKAS